MGSGFKVFVASRKGLPLEGGVGVTQRYTYVCAYLY